MTLNCFVCNTSFQELSLHCKHFKLIHGLDSYSEFKCIADCNQIFSNISSFQRYTKSHLKNMLQRINVNEERNSENINSECINLNSDDLLSCYIPILLENDVSNLKTITFIKSKCLISKTSKEFSMNLHKRNNITRKDVLDIQQGVYEFSKRSSIWSTKCY